MQSLGRSPFTSTTFGVNVWSIRRIRRKSHTKRARSCSQRASIIAAKLKTQIDVNKSETRAVVKAVRSPPLCRLFAANIDANTRTFSTRRVKSSHGYAVPDHVFGLPTFGRFSIFSLIFIPSTAFDFARECVHSASEGFFFSPVIWIMTGLLVGVLHSSSAIASRNSQVVEWAHSMLILCRMPFRVHDLW